MNEPRYAVYFAPEDETALAQFGWPWLGRTPDNAKDTPFHSAVRDDPDHAARVADPRVYGLHATLKPPFHLAEGQSRDGLVAAMQNFCAARKAIEAPALTLDEISSFIAFRLPAPEAAIDALAADCVMEFDRFRAPPTTEDIAKRAASGLTPRQHEYLARWGYPYVLDQFRFHVTLTGRLGDEERAQARTLLRPLVEGVEREPLIIRSLCLFEQPRRGERFVPTARVPFAG